MKIGLCCDDKYAMACGICMLSILENNDPESIEFIILCDNVSEESKNKLQSTAKSNGAKIKLIDVSYDLFEGLKASPLFPRSIYFRYLYPDLLPCDSKLLYLDCDTLVRGSLKDLWDTNLEGYACGLIQDQCGDDIRHYNRLQIPMNSRYFNSGVILFNLDYWRQKKIMKKCIAYISENPEKCVFPDQDALNFVLNGFVRQLSFKYNFQGGLFVKESDLMLDRSVWQDVEESKKDPVIIHFTGPVKAWHKDSTHIVANEWKKLLKKSKWSNYKLKYSYSLPWWYKFIQFMASPLLKRYSNKNQLN